MILLTVLNVCFCGVYYSVVVDKDQNPRWNPARIEDVTKEKVDWYFSALPDGERELIL